MIAHRLRQPIILGYLVIGAAIALMRWAGSAIEGWFSPCHHRVALLMFTLGLEVSVAQLRQVGRVGLWGGVIQIAVNCRCRTSGRLLWLRADAG